MSNINKKYSVRYIHKYISYDDEVRKKYKYEMDSEIEDNCLIVGWDMENDKIDRIMEDDFRPILGKKLNLMWVDKIKEKAKWKEGEILYINTKVKYGEAFCWLSRDREENGSNHVIIDKLGYASMKYYNNYTFDSNTEDIQHSFFVRADSYYNDNISRMLDKKKVKAS
jgi:hypothetical protein